MAVTLRQKWDSYRWYMYEKGLQVIWNEMNQIINSKEGSSVVGGTTSNSAGTYDITSENFVLGDAARPFSGALSASNSQSGKKVMIPDPGGNFGATPLRLANSLPTAGFIS